MCRKGISVKGVKFFNALCQSTANVFGSDGGEFLGWGSFLFHMTSCLFYLCTRSA